MAVPGIRDWLGRRARFDPDGLALAWRDHTWTWSDLDRAASAGVAALVRADVAPGDRVGVLARNGSGFVVALHAVARLGAVLAPLNVRLTQDELGWQVRDAGVAALLHDAANAGAATDLAARFGFPTVLIGDDGFVGVGSSSPADDDQSAPTDVQAVVYTSGTTGRPKGAQITFGNWWAGVAASALHLGHRTDDRWLASLPLFHVGGLAILFRSVLAGVPVTLLDGFDPDEAAAVIERDRVTLVSVVAATLARLLDQPDPGRWRSLRVALLGGGPATQALVAEAVARGIPVAPTYGLTEAASQVTTLPPGSAAGLPGCAGFPLPHMEVRVERDGKAVADGGDGEIAIRGAGVMRGYLHHPALAPEDWFRTGDLGRMDERGRLYVLDRRDDLIVSGGENVYPAEIEAALLRHPDLRDAAAVAVPDPVWGSAPVAYVAHRPGTTPDPDAILAAVAEVLAPYKRPRQILIVDDIPRNAAGKVLRRVLRERWGESAGETGGG